MRTLRLLPLVGVLFASAPASAQVSIWLQRGVSGYGFSTGLSFVPDTDATTLQLGGGYSYEGWIDFDLNLGYTWFSQDFGFGEIDFTGISLTPGVQWHPVKQSKTVPISFVISGAFSYGILDSDVFEGEEALNSYGLGLGASVYRFFRLGQNVGVIPAAGVTVLFTQSTYTDPTGEEIDLEGTEDTSVGVNLGAYIAFLDSAGRIWGVVPQVTIGDETIFTISVGVIFSKAPPEPPPPPPPPPPAPPPPQ